MQKIKQFYQYHAIKMVHVQNRWAPCQKVLFDAGILYTKFVKSVQEEFERLTKLGVEFTMKQTEKGTLLYAILNCFRLKFLA